MIEIRPDTVMVPKPPLQNRELPIQVLYVDDEADLLEIGKRLLENTGTFAVTILSSVGEGLRALEDHSFDAIVSDYQMPEMDGITFLKEIRHQGDQTPFILFTGKGREEIAIEAYENGADHYVQKGGGPRAQFVDLAHKIRRSVEMHMVEEKSLTLTRRLDFMSRVNKAIARNRDRDALLGEICDLATQYGTFELCWAGFIDPEQSMVIPYIARSGNGRLPDIPGITLSDPEEGEGDDPCGDALIRGYPFACNDITRLQVIAKWNGWAKTRGYRSICSVPLRLFGDLIGAFIFFSKRDEAFDMNQIEMLTEVGSQISFALSILEGESRSHGREDAPPMSEIRDRYQDLDHLLNLIDLSSDGILLTDEDGIILIWNQSMERITGISTVQAKGIPLSAIIAILSAENDPDECRQIEQMLRAGPASYPERSQEITLITPGGERKQIEAIRSVLQTGCGFRIQSIVHEICGQSSLNTTDLTSDSQYMKLIDNLPEVIYSVDEHGLITCITPAIERLSSYTALELIGRELSELAHPEDRPALKTVITAAIQGEDSPDLIFRVQDRDGMLHHMQGSHHLVNRKEVNIRLIGILSEVTTHTRTSNTQQIILKDEDPISEAIRHTLLNQITAMNCYIELLIEDSRDTDLTDQYLEKIKEISSAIQNQII